MLRIEQAGWQFIDHCRPSPNLLQLLKPLCAPSFTVAVRQRLFKLTEEHDLPVPLSANTNLDRSAINRTAASLVWLDIASRKKNKCENTAFQVSFKFAHVNTL